MNELKNTDKEIWREIEGEYYSPSIFVTEQGKIGINVGGVVYVQSVEKWHQQADRIAELEKQLTFQPNQTLACPSYLSGLTPQIKELSDRELVVFLMDEIDRASEWLVDGETHMAIGVLGQCHAKIRKHLSNTKESE